MLKLRRTFTPTPTETGPILTRLGTTEAAVKSAMQRLRERHREILREVIAQTVTSATEVEEEIRHMREVLNR